MTLEEFSPYPEALIREYAADHVQGGRWTQRESLGEARKEVERLLSQGVRTPGHDLFKIRAKDDGRWVGTLWVNVDRPRGFVYDLRIDEIEQGKGFGRATMLAGEEVARSRGATQLGLHVFADNERARRLYTSLGYRETNVVMSKTLSEGRPKTRGRADPAR